jgi:hypothetical protein
LVRIFFPLYSLKVLTVKAFGPGLWEGYGGVVFPAIADAMFLKDVAVIQAAVDLTTAGVNRVTEFIRLP